MSKTKADLAKELAELTADIQEREQFLEEKDAEIVAAQEALAEQEADLKAREEALAEQEADGADEQPVVEEKEPNEDGLIPGQQVDFSTLQSAKMRDIRLKNDAKAREAEKKQKLAALADSLEQ